MTISQQGTFRHGTYGFPVEITLSSSPIDLSAATTINLAVTRPDSSAFAVNLGLGSIISIPNGVIRWTPENGHLTISGSYELLLTIAFGPSMTLTVEGWFKVS